MRARLAALAPTISARDARSFDPTADRDFIRSGEAPLRLQIRKHVLAQEMTEVREPIGRPLQRPREVDHRRATSSDRTRR